MLRLSSLRQCVSGVLLLGFLVCCSFVFLGLLEPRRDVIVRLPDDVPAPIQSNALAFTDDQPDEYSTWMKRRLTDELTPLGKWLLSEEGIPPPPKTTNRTSLFHILIWENGIFLERRHLRRFSRNKKYSPWDGCSVTNCRLTYKSSDLHSVDAVVFHMHRTTNAASLPERRNLKQRWIFLSDESPINTFLNRRQNVVADYNGMFNWTMTYRMNSDVPVPYGRTVPIANSNEVPDESEFWVEEKWLPGGRDRKLAAVLGSNCGGNNNRWKYVKELKKIFGDKLSILGRCLDGNRTACPGHFDRDCEVLSDFRFYLAFENSNCREYLSEKVFWNAYAKRAVPVIMGASRSDCRRLLPPGSYLHVDDFANPASLAAYMLYLERQPLEYDKYHGWRERYRVLNEHGYFGSASRHYCRLCEALNYNDQEPKVYEDLAEFWDVGRDCYGPAIP